MSQLQLYTWQENNHINEAFNITEHKLDHLYHSKKKLFSSEVNNKVLWRPCICQVAQLVFDINELKFPMTKTFQKSFDKVFVI